MALYLQVLPLLLRARAPQVSYYSFTVPSRSVRNFASLATYSRISHVPRHYITCDGIPGQSKVFNPRIRHTSLRVCLLAITSACSRLRRSPDLFYSVEQALRACSTL